MKTLRIKFQMLMVLLLLLPMATAQADKGNLEKINKIKKNHSYVYGEATMTEKPAALQAAMDILEANILEWVTERSKADVEKIVATDIRHLVDTIFLRRVNMVRAFVYVKKSKLIPVFSKSGLAIIDPSANNDNEESIGETRVIDSSSAPFKGNTESHAVNPDEKPQVEQKDNLAADEHNITQNKSVEKNVSPQNSDSKTKALQKIQSVRSFFDLESVMKPLKQQGIIADYGKYSTLKNPEEAYLIIYDPAGNIRAVLDPGTDTRRNLKTNADDSLKNYRGCGAIWFKFRV